MVRLEDAESFAREKGANVDFCKSMIFRLKSIGVVDNELFCAAYLSRSESSFDEIFSRFGREIATIVASISKDKSLPRQKQEEQYLKQLQDAPWNSILVKLCEISANLKFIKEAEISRNKRSKMLKQNVHLLLALRKAIAKNKDATPGIERLLEGLNENLIAFKQRPIQF